LDEFPIKINGTPSPLVYRADVKTQIQQSDESWKDEAATSVYLGSANKSSDPATISATGEAFGGSGGLSGKTPINPGSIWWDLSNNQVRASVLGTLYFTRQPGVSARLRLKTFDVHGAQLQNWPMPTKKPSTTSGTDQVPINYGSAANSLIYR